MTKKHKFEIQYVYTAHGTKETREKTLLMEKNLIHKKKTKEQIEEEIKKYFKNAILKEVSPASLINAFKFVTNKPPYEINMYFIVSEYEMIAIKAKVYYN